MKDSIGLKAKDLILLQWKHHAVELFLRIEHKNNLQEGTEHVRTVVQQKMWILVIQNALQSIQNKCVTCRKDRAQMIAPVMANLPEEWLDASTSFTKTGVDYYGHFTVKFSRKNKQRLCSVHMSNCESGAHRSGTQVK